MIDTRSTRYDRMRLRKYGGPPVLVVPTIRITESTKATHLSHRRAHGFDEVRVQRYFEEQGRYVRRYGQYGIIWQAHR